MVTLNKIYTRTGDEGDTGLVTGERRAKNDPRISAYGTVDEANAAIGMARLHLSGELDAILGRVQNDLFDLGADLATPESEAQSFEPLRVSESQVQRVEHEIDSLNENLEPLTSFVLPGGSPAAAALHLARTIMRRAERDMVAAVQAGDALSGTAMRYANRVSDLLFVAARAANGNGATDVTWTPGAHR